MRLKISLAALAAIGVATVVGFRVAGDHADGATKSAAAPAMMAMPVPVVPVVEEDAADLSRLSRTHRIDPQHRPAGAGVGLH